MRALFLIAGLMAASVSGTVLAQTIVVADSTAALMGSNEARKIIEKLQVELKPQRERMDALRKEAQAIEQRFQKDKSVLGEKGIQDLQKQAESKISEYNNIAQVVQKRTQETQNDLLQKMLPKMEAVIDELRKAGGYEIILEKKSVIFADTTVDITRKITEKLNAAK